MKQLFYILLFIGLSLNAQDFTYEGYISDVYDGDTVTATVVLGFQTLTVQKLRLYGINAPEMRGDEKEQGTITRDSLRNKILGQKVTVQTIRDKKGKYGRYLAIIYKDTLNINQWLVDKGLAKVQYY